jgi:hypothetical protein
MANNNSHKDKPSNWGKLGGNNSMHGWSGTGTQTPGGSSQEGSGSKKGIAPKAGPSNVMGFSTSGNKSYAGTQTAGQSSAMPTGGNAKFAEGGSTKMFGNRGSQRAEGGKSSPC